MRITTSIPTINARLSFTPNVLIANDFSHSGVASIMALPTATSGDDWSSMNEATTSAIPKAKSAVSTPRPRPGAVASEPAAPWSLTSSGRSR